MSKIDGRTNTTLTCVKCGYIITLRQWQKKILRQDKLFTDGYICLNCRIKQVLEGYDE